MKLFGLVLLHRIVEEHESAPQHYLVGRQPIISYFLHTLRDGFTMRCSYINPHLSLALPRVIYDSLEPLHMS